MKTRGLTNEAKKGKIFFSKKMKNMKKVRGKTTITEKMFMVHGSRCMVHVSRFMVHGSVLLLVVVH